MKIKVVAYTADEEGQHSPGEILDMREGTALEWIKRGWAIARPDLEEKVKPKEEAQPVVPERAIIETPEDHSMADREDASITRRRRNK